MRVHLTITEDRCTMSIFTTEKDYREKYDIDESKRITEYDLIKEIINEGVKYDILKNDTLIISMAIKDNWIKLKETTKSKGMEKWNICEEADLDIEQKNVRIAIYC